MTLKNQVIKDSASFAKVIDNLGYSFYKMGNSKGIDYLRQALKIKLRLRDDLGMASSYINLTKYYNQHNPGLSNTYALLAYEKATKANNVDNRLESLALLIQTNSGNQSKIYSEKYIHINDSITKIGHNARNQFAKIKYDSKKDKEENQLLKTRKLKIYWK